jgi:predicted nucleic acid-binding protein
MRELRTLPLTTVAVGAAAGWGEAMDMARRHRLTLYEACYLELALRHSAELLSCDAAMRRAASVEGVALLTADVKSF